MLETDRYCPRCDTRTRWSNEHDRGVHVACTVCGLTAASDLTEDERERVLRLDAKPVLRRRSWVAV